MSTELDEAEAALARARTDLVRTCSSAVSWLGLMVCMATGYLMAAGWVESSTACTFWRTIEDECHDDACLLRASATRPWGCGPNPRSVVSESVAKARLRIEGPP